MRVMTAFVFLCGRKLVVYQSGGPLSGVYIRGQLKNKSLYIRAGKSMDESKENKATVSKQKTKEKS